MFLTMAHGALPDLVFIPSLDLSFPSSLESPMFQPHWSSFSFLKINLTQSLCICSSIVLTLLTLIFYPHQVLYIQKTKIMASGPITSWEIDGETVETVSNVILQASKLTADGDCSHEIKRCLLLGRRVMIYLDNIFKSRDLTLPTKVLLERKKKNLS